MINERLLTQWFEKFNKLYFHSSLPLPVWRITNTKRQLGSYRRQELFSQETNKSHYLHEIAISRYFQQTEKEYQRTLLHEMIHYYISYHDLPDTAPHGAVFTRIMNCLNQRYGWNISVTSPREKMRAAAPQRPSVVLILEIEGKGKAYTVINPRYALQLESSIKQIATITHYHWYLTIDPHLSHYPKVRTLRVTFITESKWEELQKVLVPCQLITNGATISFRPIT